MAIEESPLAIKRGRESLGFPGWREVCDWLNEDILAPEPDEAVMSMSAVKNHEIPKLGSYSEIPDSSFWDNFPKMDIPVFDLNNNKK